MPSLNLASTLVEDDRSSGRYRLLLEAERGATGGTSVTLHDLSQSGLLFEAEQGIPGDAEISLDIPGIGPVLARTVWTNGSFYGAQFGKPLTPDRLKAALAASKVVWPAFSAPAPIDIEQARSRLGQPDLALAIEQVAFAAPDLSANSSVPATAIVEEAKLPLPVRIRIIVGLTLTLWAGIFGILWLALG